MEEELENIKTGDVILCSGNTPTGFLLRTFISSEWNHSGIAVRLINNNGYYVSLTNEGELYILETNTGARFDDISQTTTIGAAFSRAKWVFNKYNKIAVRKLREEFRTPDLARLTMEFYWENRGHTFPNSALPFISVWLGIPLGEKDDNTMFCSELMANYYRYCIGPQYPGYDGKLSTLFGYGSPTEAEMYTPGHYTRVSTPNASIFRGKEIVVYKCPADLYYVILQPLIIILVVMLVIWMSLPH